MVKHYKFSVSMFLEEVFSALAKKLSDYGSLQFHGNEESGGVKGMGLVAEYKIVSLAAETQVDIAVLDKPFILRWRTVEKQIEHFFSELSEVGGDSRH
jgi:hypothetical protein